MTRLPDNTAITLPVPALTLLSPRELELVRLLARQMSTTQMAAAMSITVNTVRTRAHRALAKLGTEDREEAVQTAHDRGLV